MKAAVFSEPGALLELADVADPRPGPNDLVIKVNACGICGSDLHASDQHSRGRLPKGTIMGHEFAGEVYEVGAAIKDQWRVGDRLCALPYIACGHCQNCLNGKGFRCAHNRATGLGDIPGAYAEYVRVGAFESIRLPDGVSDHEGATVEPLAVALHAVKQANLKIGDSVLILGAGPIGLALTQWCRFFGVKDIIVSEKAKGRLEMAAKFGATDCIDSTKDSPQARFQQITGRLPDIVFEAVGVPGMIQESISLVRTEGKVVVVGVCMQQDQFFPTTAILKEIQLQFVLAYHKQDFEFTVAMLEQGRLFSAPMITDVVNLNELPSAFEALRTPESQCKIIVEPSAS